MKVYNLNHYIQYFRNEMGGNVSMEHKKLSYRKDLFTIHREYNFPNVWPLLDIEYLGWN